MKKLAFLYIAFLCLHPFDVFAFTALSKSPHARGLGEKSARITLASQLPNTSRQSSQLKASSSNDANDDEDDEEDELIPMQASSEMLENARNQFESMMSMPNDNVENNAQELEFASKKEEELFKHGTRTISKAVLSNLNSPPPLTAVLRERREKEIELLNSLRTSDNAVSDLWSLWIAERGSDAAAKIKHAEELISVESWSEAETEILALIEEHGIHWAEPVNRLATLYYMLGRYEESKALCELVLDIKPWHFGALSGIVLVCIASNDVSEANHWSQMRLPPGGKRRVEWTNNAVEQAEKSLHEASLVGKNKEIGVEEIEFRRFRAQLEKGHNTDTPSEESSGDCWQ